MATENKEHKNKELAKLLSNPDDDFSYPISLKKLRV